MRKYFLLYCLVFLGEWLLAQQYNDGPVQIMMRQREWDVVLPAPNDASLNVSFVSLGAISEDEYAFKIWGRGNSVNTTWYGGNCFTDELDPSLVNSIDFNDVFYNQTFTGSAVPYYMDLRIDNHEDDMYDLAYYLSWTGGLVPCANLGTYPYCDYDAPTCCINFFGCLYTEGDDLHCDANPFKTNVNYRTGPPCQWYNQGFIAGTTGVCADNVYQPRIETFWRYTKGTACNDAIDLGTLPTGGSVFHFNSNECYSNNFPNSSGNDVFYQFSITQPMGVKATMCGAASFNTYMYLLDASCNVITSNDDYCNLTSEITRELCAPGVYYVVVDGATAADMGTFTLTISEQPGILLDANAGPDKNVCLGATAVLGGIPAAQFGAGGYTYNWTPATGLNNPTLENPTLTATGTGTSQYILAVTDANNCTIYDTMNVLVVAPPVAGISSNTNIICSGTSAAMTGTGGTGTPPYQWLFNNGTLPGATSSVYNATLQGNYSVVAYNSIGCGDTSTQINIQVVSGALANISATNGTTACQGDTVTLNGYGIGINYQWLNNNIPIAGATSNTFFATNSGNYSVILSFGGQCSDTSAVLPVTINANPTATISPNTAQTICQGQTVFFSATGGTSYQWYMNGLPIAGATNSSYAATQSGNYYAVATTNNCSKQTSVVNVVVKPVVPATITAGGNNTFCQGSNSLLVGSGTGAGQTYQWLNNGALVGTNNTYTANATGNYQFILNNNGCADTSNIFAVTVNPLPTATISPSGAQTTCSANPITLTASGGTTYTWYFNGVMVAGNSSPSIVTSGTGNYYATVTSAAGCSDNTPIVPITVNPTIPANITPMGATVFCQGGNVLLAGSGTGTAGETYLWLNANGTSVGTSNSLQVSNSGTYTFILNNNGCADTSAAITVTVNPNPTPTLSPAANVTICEGQSVDILVSSAGTFGINWYVNGVAMSASPNPLTAFMAASYYAEVIDANGCTGTTLPTIVSVTDVIEATISPQGNTDFCQGETLNLQGSGTGQAGQTYTWLQLPTNIVGNNNTTTVSTAGNYQFITDNFGCRDTSAALAVTVFPLPIVSLIANGATAICEGTPLLLTAGGASFYTWLKNGQILPVSVANTLTVTGAGTYYTIGTDTNGCQSISPYVWVTNLPIPNANVSANGSTVICPGESVSLNAQGGDTYQWLWNSGILPNETNDNLIASTSGAYNVIATTPCGTDTSGVVTVQVSPQPAANFYTQEALNFINTPVYFIDQSTNASVWQWNFGDGSSMNSLQNPAYVYSQAGTYLVNLVINDEIGCKDTVEMNIVINEAIPFVPNIFSPNEDGIYDNLETNFAAFKSFRFQIADRWGTKVFATNDPAKQWDGKYNGKYVALGTYYYALTGTDFAGKELVFKGWIEVVR